MNLIEDIVVKSIFHFLLINSKGENKQSPSIVQLSIRKRTLILTTISYLLSSLSVFTFIDINLFGGYQQLNSVHEKLIGSKDRFLKKELL
jgi:hypothetical protein